MLTEQELRQIGGLNTDGVEGFRAQMRDGTETEVVWPPHLVGVRIDNFRKGSAMARSFLIYQRALGNARRKARAEERSTLGHMDTLIPQGEDRRAEEVENFRTIAKRFS